MGKRKTDTKLSILHCATKLFLEKGYTAAYITTIAKELNISTGNLTFHYPTKEDLLAEIVKELFAFQFDTKGETEEQTSPVVLYLRELIIITAICEENSNVKDLITAAYTHSLPLKVIRENDGRKAAERFGNYCPDWSAEDFAKAENIVSGIEYAMLMTENAEMISLEERYASSVNAIMRIYQVPEEDRKKFIKEVLVMDWRNMERQVFEKFCDYVGKKNPNIE